MGSGQTMLSHTCKLERLSPRGAVARGALWAHGGCPDGSRGKPVRRCWYRCFSPHHRRSRRQPHRPEKVVITEKRG
ncbi:hypothetical protein E2C01_076611 [Portunus trituberculatus]|uniref:Uncharacterized protein n=1 Tax=Portunus trituberculatus TaxID=210409 RepID=A0A5B7IJ68_PORTR|nr:hypothetical protein [Portunus trituberculatus]